MKTATKLVLALLFAMTVSTVAAFQPITIPMEVRNNTGGIANDTSFVFNFTFYDNPTGGRLLYNETQTIITDHFGRVFPIINTTGINNGTTVWLEMNISNITMTPRLRITGTLYAESAEQLQNQTRSTFTVGNLTTNNLTLQGNLTHNLGGVLINSTGGINASAAGFGSIPLGVLNLLFSTVNTWTAGQIFTNVNVSGSLNITGSSTADNLLAVYSRTGIRLFSVNHAGDVVNSFIKLNVSDSGEDAALRVSGDIGTVLRVSTIGGGFTHIQGTLNITNLTSGTTPNPTLLINDTGGINASAVGFGSIPVGVLGNLFSTVNLWTAGQIFIQGLNTTGPVNITTQSGDSFDAFTVFSPAGVVLTRISNTRFHTSQPVNITALSNANAFSVRNNFGVNIFRVESNGGGIIHAESTLNITNITHTIGGLLVNSAGGINASAIGFGTVPQGVLDTIRNWTAGQIFGKINLTGVVNISAPVYTSGNISSIFGGLLVNETGGINASAVGFGTIPTGVLPVFPSGQAVPVKGLRAAFGTAIGVATASNSVEEIVNMSAGFSCTACYSVVASNGNQTVVLGGTYTIININASQFNITVWAGGAPKYMNASWIAIGY